MYVKKEDKYNNTDKYFNISHYNFNKSLSKLGNIKTKFILKLYLM